MISLPKLLGSGDLSYIPSNLQKNTSRCDCVVEFTDPKRIVNTFEYTKKYFCAAKYRCSLQVRAGIQIITGHPYNYLNLAGTHTNQLT